MKIGDVKVGVEYGVLDSPKTERHNAHKNMRQVEVLEVVVEEERVFGSGYLSSADGHRMRKVKRLKVKVLDKSSFGSSDGWGYSRSKLKYADQGAVLVIEARQVVGAWSELRSGIVKQREAEQKRIDAQEALEARIVALIGKGETAREYRWRANVTEYDGKLRAEGSFHDKSLDKLLTLAEAGKGKA
jgi:hypothetical protein